MNYNCWDCCHHVSVFIECARDFMKGIFVHKRVSVEAPNELTRRIFDAIVNGGVLAPVFFFKEFNLRIP